MSIRVALPFALFAIFSIEMAPVAARAQARPALGAIDGMVTDTSLAPLSDATISIMGSPISVATAASGRFRVTDLTPDNYILLVRHLGFEATTIKLVVSSGETLRMSFALDRVTTKLDPVMVEAAMVPARFSEFETRRRNHEATASITREDIVKRNPVDTWQMLTNVSALLVVTKGGITLASNRRTENGPKRCYMNVMVDGVMMAPERLKGGGEAFDLANLPNPGSIYGIEVFAGGASVPLQYGGEGKNGNCGIIAIWTR